MDVNDNFPEFYKPVHVLPIEKLTTAGTQLAKFFATDSDEGNLGKVTFKLEDDDQDLFQISKNGKKIFVDIILQNASKLFIYLILFFL